MKIRIRLISIDKRQSCIWQPLISFIMDQPIIIPAIAALKQDAYAPAMIALIPKRAISGLRFGESFPSPPSKMPSEERLANPQSAKLIMTTVLLDNESIIGAKLLYATNSFITIF